MSKSISLIPTNSWDNFSGFLPNNIQVTGLGDKLHKGSEILSFKSFNQFYRDFHLSNYHNPGSLVLGGIEPNTYLVGNQPDLYGLDDMQKMMALDQISYLPDDILVKVDRASMAASLETRVPFLDHRIVEFSWSLPQSFKFRDGQSKWPLRQILYKYVPQHLIDRPKSGFSIPLNEWLRGPLRDWAEELLNERRLNQEGIFNSDAVRTLWLDHQSGKRNWAQILWSIIMFQAWLEEQ